MELGHNARLTSTTEGIKTEAKAEEVGTGEMMTTYSLNFFILDKCESQACLDALDNVDGTLVCHSALVKKKQNHCIFQREEPYLSNGVAPLSPSSESKCKMQQTEPVTTLTRCSMCCKNCTVSTRELEQ